MIEAAHEQEIAIIAPRGSYAQAELADAVERALALCPGGSARGLILDFSSALGVGQRSIVRVRETTRELIQRGPRYARRLAVVARGDDVVRVIAIGGALCRWQGIDYEVCANRSEAMQWILDGSSPSTA
jgi:hypothetical protein